MSKLRFRVVETAFKKKAVEVATPAERPSEYFAKYVFNKEKMFKYLPSKVYNALIDAIDNGAPLDRSIADEVAAGMKKWAIEMGVTHYTHWFSPLTEGTAEKHDAFVEHRKRGPGLLLSAGRMEWTEVRMAEAGRQYRNVDRCAELLCCFCASVEEGKGRTGGTGKTFGTASDGLSSSASEIYTSDSGRNDSEAGISEDGSRLYENKTGKRQVCI